MGVSVINSPKSCQSFTFILISLLLSLRNQLLMSFSLSLVPSDISITSSPANTKIGLIIVISRQNCPKIL